MFVSKKEIEARLISDENLLVTLLKDSPVTTNSSNGSSEESSKDSNAEPMSANVIPVVGELVNDNDVKLSSIIESATQELSARSEIDNRRSGRPRDAINRSTEQRADIALMGKVLGHSLAADLLGVSTASSSLHARGKVNHQDEDIDKELVVSVKKKLNRIRNKSADGIIHLLDNLDKNQLLEKVNTAKDAVAIAGQLAGIIQKVQPKEEEIKPTAQFFIYQPQTKEVSDYDVIPV